MNGGIISTALGLIKEKERQGDKAMERLHDGMKTQMELTANQGSWTGDSKGSEKVVKEKIVEKEKVKEPQKDEEEESPSAPASADDEKEDVSNLGIMGLAQRAGI